MAAPPPFRDLLGHLCAEIERQQAQIGEQGEQIAELVEENHRLHSELDAARSAVLNDWSGLQTPASPEVDGRHPGCRQDAGCQTAPCICQPDTDAVKSVDNIGLSHWADKLQQPEPAPEPLELASAPCVQQMGTRPRLAAVNLQHSFAAVLTSSAHASAEWSNPQRLEEEEAEDLSSQGSPEREFSGSQWHGRCIRMRAEREVFTSAAVHGESSTAEEDAHPWSLSPSSFNSNASSPFWFGLGTRSFPSSSPAPVAGGGQQPPTAADLQSEEIAGWPGMRRQPPGQPRLLENSPCAEAALASAATGPLEPRRLVRVIVDALDAAQRRLQQASAQQKATPRTGTVRSQGCEQAQLDIRIYYATCARAEVNAGDECEAVAGSFMYILL